MTTDLVVVAQPQYGEVVRLVLNALDSPKSKAVYKVALERFIAWYVDKGTPGLTKALVQEWKAALLEDGLASRSVNVYLSAVRRLAEEAADNGLLEPGIAAGIGRVRGVAVKGRRLGLWLSLEDAQELLGLPDVATVKGLRDRAIIALLLGTGLRRSELVSLTVAHFQEREGRPALVDIEGKGWKLRSVPVPGFAHVAVGEWLAKAEIVEGPVFRRVRKNGLVGSEPLTDRAVYYILQQYHPLLGAHDLRRTFGTLAVKGGAPLDQVQKALGHASIQTTEGYLNLEQDFAVGPGDVIRLEVV